VPTVVAGSIPPNKSDFTEFQIAWRIATNGDTLLYLDWTRTNVLGSADMDFELNQSSTLSSNGVTPVRTQGDLLITYDFANGANNVSIHIATWNGNATSGSWSALTTLNSSQAVASIADSLLFGELAIDLNAAGIFTGTTCESFSSAYLKSRSSDSFQSELKDFVKPKPVNITNCGSVKVVKNDDAGAPLAGAEFTLYNDNAPVGGSRGAEDTVTSPVLKCTTGATGTCTISNVFKGDYWLVETVVPAGHDGVADQHVTVTSDTEVTVGPLVDPRQRGAIKVTKLRKHAADGPGDHPQSGVDFTVNGVTGTTDANGQACFDGLLFGSYTVHETVPSGYKGEADKTVTVDNRASCADASYVGESVTFHNTPLSNVTVSFESQVSGGTASQISCTGLTATPADGTPNAFDDTSETFKNLEPGTYTCTVVIDP
jgi:hypothetical protein